MRGGHGAANQLTIAEINYGSVVGTKAAPRSATAWCARPYLIVGLAVVFTLKLIGEDGEVFGVFGGLVVSDNSHFAVHHLRR